MQFEYLVQLRGLHAEVHSVTKLLSVVYILLRHCCELVPRDADKLNQQVEWQEMEKLLKRQGSNSTRSRMLCMESEHVNTKPFPLITSEQQLWKIGTVYPCSSCTYLVQHNCLLCAVIACVSHKTPAV